MMNIALIHGSEWIIKVKFANEPIGELFIEC